MRFSKRLVVAALSIAIASAAGCSKSEPGPSGPFPPGSGSINPSCNTSASFTRPTPLATNKMSVSVAGSLCTGPGASGSLYPDEICATVTICTPGCDGQCQTISDVLLDTGSYGLRLFSDVLTIPLKQVSNDGASSVAECVGFGDGSSEWGPVEVADIMLAGEPVIQSVPVLVINSTFSSPPAACDSNNSSPDRSPSQAGFNGILGVGLFAQDCGDECATDSNNTQYYSCTTSGGCGGTTVPDSLQVTNPVALMSQDNNGVILTLPAIPNSGAPNEDGGNIIFGIDTQTNNVSGSRTFLSADAEGNFRTIFQSKTMKSFIDSGSSDLAFATTGVPDCSGHDQQAYFAGAGSQFYCPNDTGTGSPDWTTPLNFPGVTQTSADGNGTSNFSFNLVNAYYLLFVANNMGNFAFSTIGGPTGGQIGGFFDWGLPFFFGKSIAVSIDQTKFAGGANTGPGWAY